MRSLFFIITLAAAGTVSFGQSVKATTDIVIDIEGGRSMRLTASDLAKLPHIETRATDHDGVEAVFSGVELKSILLSAGAKFGKDLRGPAVGQYVIVEAADGYHAVFSLTDLDQEFTDKVVILADRKGGKPLAGKDGPWQVIATNEKKHARWARQVTTLKLRTAR